MANHKVRLTWDIIVFIPDEVESKLASPVDEAIHAAYHWIKDNYKKDSTLGTEIISSVRTSEYVHELNYVEL